MTGINTVGLRRRGFKREVIRTLEKAVELGDHLQENRMALGLAFHEAGRFAEAIENFNQALKLDPNLTDAEKWKQQSLKRLGRGS